ncbi:MAG: aspartate aminotransferase family protein [Armatimonadetes bacterium]|nr:aspartate aminotransferase family protein [Armatimonadota bacterium]MDW8120974.1 aspartate aminotransferase family protein [Armatimonadota bacterium]
MRYLAQTSATPLGLQIEDASGCWLTDHKGRRFLDLIAGIAVNSIGHRHPAVFKAVQAQLDRYWHANVYGEFVLASQVSLAEKLCQIVAQAQTRATNKESPPLQFYPTNSGTEANEGALKLARKYTGRKKFVAFHNSYHGDTFGSLSVTGRDVYRKPFEPLLADVVFLNYGDLSGLDQVDEETAAVIAEPIQGEAGIIVPPDGFFATVRKACDRSGAVLILDEIQTGFGRTGKWFAFEHWGVAPDIVTVGKALGGGFPISGFLAPLSIMETLSRDPPLCHVTTFGGHPVASAAAAAALEVLKSFQLPERAAQIGCLLKQRLHLLKRTFPDLIADVRGLGAMWGIEFSRHEICDAFVRLALKHHLIVCRTLHGRPVIRLSPPLIISEGELDWALSVMEGILREIRESPASTSRKQTQAPLSN